MYAIQTSRANKEQNKENLIILISLESGNQDRVIEKTSADWSHNKYKCIYSEICSG